ncbi:MAG: hypothetical protein ABIZ30_02075 [Candidatus Limnocylindrales bacterium]
MSLVLRFGQTRSQDPNELGHRLRADLGPSVRQVVLHGRVREAQAVLYLASERGRYITGSQHVLDAGLLTR